MTLPRGSRVRNIREIGVREDHIPWDSSSRRGDNLLALGETGVTNYVDPNFPGQYRTGTEAP
eukprot:scaffold2632_cov384-Pavlova_lutheri.AAC.3